MPSPAMRMSRPTPMKVLHELVSRAAAASKTQEVNFMTGEINHTIAELARWNCGLGERLGTTLSPERIRAVCEKV